MNNYDFLHDQDFLQALNRYKIRELHCELTVLDFTDAPIKSIAGLVQSGNISINGNSSTQRTLSISMLFSDENANLMDINNLISINKKIKCRIGLTNPFKWHDSWANYGDIIWFKMGEYYVTSASASVNATAAWTISVTAIDKMAMLNGTLGGTFPASVSLHELLNVEDNGDITIEYPLIYTIIYELVQHFGNENPSKIIINDVPLEGRQVIKYAGTEPIYLPDSVNWSGNTARAFQFTDPGSGYFAVYNGQKMGYLNTPLTYPGELVFNGGATVTEALDAIVKTLGNYVYYYDLEGNFRFEYLNEYFQTENVPILDLSKNADYDLSAWLPLYSQTDYINEFKDTEVISSISINPKYENIKNDFIVWGQVGKANSSEEEFQVRYHLAIDKKPQLVTGTGVTPSYSNGQWDFDYPAFDSLSTKFIWEVKQIIPQDENQSIKCLINTGAIVDGYLGKTLRYIFTNTATINAALYGGLAGGQEAIDLSTSPTPPTYGTPNAFSMDGSINEYDYREELYRRALWAWNLSIKGSEYDEELLSEWRKIYDPRSTTGLNTQSGINWGNNLGVDSFQYKWEHHKDLWQTFYSVATPMGASWGPWSGWNPDVLENPEKLDYWLEILDNDKLLGEFSISKIGKRTKVVTNNQVNQIFPVFIPDIVYIENDGTNDSSGNPSWVAIAARYTQVGQQFSLFKTEQKYLFEFASFYGSCFETMRGLLLDNLQYQLSLNMQAIPMFYLQPNKMFYINQPKLGVQGYFQIDKITYDLKNNGMMQITAHQAQIEA